MPTSPDGHRLCPHSVPLARRHRVEGQPLRRRLLSAALLLAVLPHSALGGEPAMSMAADRADGQYGVGSAAVDVVSLDTSFGVDGLMRVDLGDYYDDIEGLAIQPDDRIVAVGTGWANSLAVTRFLPDGRLDPSFSGDGRLIIGAPQESLGSPCVAILPDDKILVATAYRPVSASADGFQAIRLNSDGSYDTSFGSGGVVHYVVNRLVYLNDLQVMPDGRFVVVGYGSTIDGWRSIVARMLPTGALDPSFGAGGLTILYVAPRGLLGAYNGFVALDVQPDDKVVAGGWTSTTDAMSTGNLIHSVVRLDIQGQLDPTFGTDGIALNSFDTGPFQREQTRDVRVLPDGRILVASYGGSDTVLYRLLPSGQVDPGFGVAGRVVAPADDMRYTMDVLLDDEGRITTLSSGFAVARFSADGVLDPAFGPGGTFGVTFNLPHERANALARLSGGDFILGGAAGSALDIALTRFHFHRGDDCNSNGIGDAHDIAQGTSQDCDLNDLPDECETLPDCNSNGHADSCDLRAGTSTDCQTDGVPDECQLAGQDCNANGSLDRCEVAAGSSPDCDGNDFPDECQPDCNANGTADACENDGDCNANGVLDACDLAAGTSADCDANTIPDECDARIGFEAVTLSTVGDGAYALDTADVDNDGDLDVIAAWYYGVTIAWYENLDGQGTFGSGRILTSSSIYATSVFAADLDEDGDVDVLATSDNEGHVGWFENLDGKGTFSPRRTITTAAQWAQSVFAADLDGDGDADVLSASAHDDKVAWYENLDGQNTFGPQRIISQSTNAARALFAADLDGDGDADVLSAGRGDEKIVWFENTDGLGAFGPQQVISTLVDRTESVVAADLDGDSDLDVLAASWDDDKVSWYENLDGLGSFGPQHVINTSADGANRAEAADLDRDGDLDVLCSSWNDDTIAWYENLDGQANFGPQRIITSATNGARWVTVADLDGDGNEDVLSASTEDDKIAWYATIWRDCDNNDVPDECELAGGDCDHDGVLDVCAPEYSDCNSNGYVDHCEVAAGSAPDVDGDRRPDECAEDCNSNGLPDDYEMAAGSGTDCNANGRLDECEIGGTTGERDCDSNGRLDTCDLYEPAQDCNGNGALDVCELAAGSGTDCDANSVLDECDPDCNSNGVADDCERVGDLTGDGYSDAEDWHWLHDCLTAPCGAAPCAPAEYADPCCRVADLDRDGDVDLRDYGALQLHYDRLCRLDSDCDDGLFCNGPEACLAGYCAAGAAPCADPGLPNCDESMDTCTPDILYEEDFSAYACGGNPSGWLDTGPNNSLLENDALFKVACLADNHALRAATVQVNVHSHYAPPASPHWPVRSFRGRMLTTSLAAGIGVTFLSDYPNSDAYYRLRRGPFAGGATFHIDPHGTTITAGTIDSGVSPAPNVWYWFHIDVTDTGTATRIRAKVWAMNAPEPPEWQIDCHDASPTRRTTGRIGVWSMLAAGSYWDDFEVR